MVLMATVMTSPSSSVLIISPTSVELVVEEAWKVDSPVEVSDTFDEVLVVTTVELTKE